MTRTLEVATFAYHEVTDDPTTSGFQRAGARPYTLTPRRFAEHLDAIAAAPCRPTLAGEIDFDRPTRHLLLTFDDGGKSALYASDQLAQRGWRGHFFIVTGLIGDRTFLDAAAIRHLRRCGHLVGSHSHTHPDVFRALTREEMAEQWRVSAAILADLLGEPCLSASVPGGDSSPTVLRSAATAGFRYLFTSEPDLRPHRVDDCRILGRVFPKAKLSLAAVRDLAQFRGWSRALLVRRLKVLVRTTLPPLYRAYLLRSARP